MRPKMNSVNGVLVQSVWWKSPSPCSFGQKMAVCSEWETQACSLHFPTMLL